MPGCELIHTLRNIQCCAAGILHLVGCQTKSVDPCTLVLVTLPLLFLTNLQVKCSGGDGTGDPENICGDKPNSTPPDCPSGQAPVGTDPDDATRDRAQAFSDPHIIDNDYSAITFCTGFFKLDNLATAVKRGLAKSVLAERDNLDSYDNRARVFFHEVTHLDYFMNTPAQGPPIDDVLIKYKQGGRIVEGISYGAYFTKVLKNYRALRKGGYYTQRNGLLSLNCVTEQVTLC